MLPARLAWWLLTPALVFVGVFFTVPVLILLSGAFDSNGTVGLAPFFEFFAEPLHQQVYWRTLRLAGLATLVSAVVCYPAAMAMIKVPPRSTTGRTDEEYSGTIGIFSK